MERVVKVLECYVEEEFWFWEDVVKFYEEFGNEEKVREVWEKVFEYYKGEV